MKSFSKEVFFLTNSEQICKASFLSRIIYLQCIPQNIRKMFFISKFYLVPFGIYLLEQNKFHFVNIFFNSFQHIQTIDSYYQPLGLSIYSHTTNSRQIVYQSLCTQWKAVKNA